MLLPSGASTTDYSRLANSRGWGAGWRACDAINSGQIVKISLTRSGASIAGGVHKNIAELFLLIGNEIERRGYMFHPSWCWGAECRAISGSNTPSNHSWGLAVDINAPNNPYTSSGQHDIPEWAFALFRSYGFGCGADYSGKKDWMHVEWMGTPSDAVIMTALARKNIGGTTPTPPTPTKDWFDMATLADLESVVERIVRKVLADPANALYINQANIGHTLDQLPRRTADELLGTQIMDGFNTDGQHPQGFPATVATYIQQGNARLVELTKGAPMPTPGPTPPATYTVKSGDTLGAIAKATGHTVAELQQWNGIADPNSIAVGQVLKLTP